MSVVAAPTKVIDTVGTTQISTSWSLAGEGLGGWLVHWKQPSATSWQTVELPASARSYVISGLKENTTYEVQIRALVGGGSFRFQATTAKGEPAPPPPAAVTWDATGEVAGPANDIFKEIGGYGGGGYASGGHPGIVLVKQTDGGIKPLTGDYLYEVIADPANGPAQWDNFRVEGMWGEPQPGNPKPEFDQTLFQYGEGDRVIFAFAFIAEKLARSYPSWTELPGIPLMQFHGQGSPPPSCGVGIKGLARPNETPRLRFYYGTGEHDAGEATEPGEFQLGRFYKILYDITVSATSGRTRAWLDRGDGQGLVLMHDYQGKNLDAAFMFPCGGGPINERPWPSNTSERPPVQKYWNNGFVFDNNGNRAAVEQRAFGAVAA